MNLLSKLSDCFRYSHNDPASNASSGTDRPRRHSAAAVAFPRFSLGYFATSIIFETSIIIAAGCAPGCGHIIGSAADYSIRQSLTVPVAFKSRPRIAVDRLLPNPGLQPTR